jgi:CheY-like chemotaxis protein
MSRPSLLVVEDNPDHLEWTLSTLAQNGASHAIAVARDGLEALDYLFCQGIYSDRNADDQPELVLLDLGLPKLGGLGVVQRMREDARTFFVPVVMLTSSSEPFQAALALEGGLNSFLSKPLAYADFEEKLQQIRNYWPVSIPGPLGF